SVDAGVDLRQSPDQVVERVVLHHHHDQVVERHPGVDGSRRQMRERQASGLPAGRCDHAGAHCLRRVATVTCGQRSPLKSSCTSCVYCNWRNSPCPPSPTTVSIQNFASTSEAVAFPPGGLAASARKAVLAVPPPRIGLCVVDTWMKVRLLTVCP